MQARRVEWRQLTAAKVFVLVDKENGRTVARVFADRGAWIAEFLEGGRDVSTGYATADDAKRACMERV